MFVLYVLLLQFPNTSGFILFPENNSIKYLSNSIFQYCSVGYLPLVSVSNIIIKHTSLLNYELLCLAMHIKNIINMGILHILNYVALTSV